MLNCSIEKISKKIVVKIKQLYKNEIKMKKGVVEIWSFKKKQERKDKCKKMIILIFEFVFKLLRCMYGNCSLW